MGTGKTDPGHT